jgi:hypothetical protein
MQDFGFHAVLLLSFDAFRASSSGGGGSSAGVTVSGSIHPGPGRVRVFLSAADGLEDIQGSGCGRGD